MVKNRSKGILAAFLTMAAFFGVFTFMNSSFYVSSHSGFEFFSHATRFWPGIAVLMAALITATASIVAHRKQKTSSRENIVTQAHRYLQRIESIRTVNRGQSTTVGVKNGVQLSLSRGSQFTERDLTLPALVDLYRDFTSNVIAWWRTRHNGQGHLLVGIDELDKIATSELAEKFINEIKAVFGISGCLYIVSTSEEALAQFEAKSPGFRSAYDSAFDDIVRSGALSLTDSRELLLRRLAGIDDPFIILCHSLSGGLPRDVLRTARSVVEARCVGQISLMAICKFLIAREIADLKQAVLLAYGTRRSAVNGKPLDGSFIGSLLNDRWPGIDSEILLSAATGRLRDAFPELHATLCFLATVCDVAANKHGEVWDTYFVPGIMLDSVEDLAAARTWLRRDPEAALELVRAARAKLGLTPICHCGDA